MYGVSGGWAGMSYYRAWDHSGAGTRPNQRKARIAIGNRGQLDGQIGGQRELRPIEPRKTAHRRNTRRRRRPMRAKTVKDTRGKKNINGAGTF